MARSDNSQMRYLMNIKDNPELRAALRRALENVYGATLVPEYFDTEDDLKDAIDCGIERLTHDYTVENVLANLDQIVFKIQEGDFLIAEGRHKLIVESYDLPSDTFACKLIRDDVGEVPDVKVPAVLIDILTGEIDEPEFFVGKSYWVGE